MQILWKAYSLLRKIPPPYRSLILETLLNEFVGKWKKSTEHNHIHFHFEWIITRNRYSTSYSLIQCVSNRAFSVYLFGMVQKRKNLAPRVFKSYLKPKNSSISFTNLWKHQKQPLPQLNLCRWPTPPNETKKKEQSHLLIL